MVVNIFKSTQSICAPDLHSRDTVQSWDANFSLWGKCANTQYSGYIQFSWSGATSEFRSGDTESTSSSDVDKP